MSVLSKFGRNFSIIDWTFMNKVLFSPLICVVTEGDFIWLKGKSFWLENVFNKILITEGVIKPYLISDQKRILHHVYTLQIITLVFRTCIAKEAEF